MSFFKQIITNVLSDLYSYLFPSCLFAGLALGLMLYAREKGWKHVAEQYVSIWKNGKQFRSLFLFMTYVCMVLFRTLLNRRLWQNTIENVVGYWRLYDSSGRVYTENIENMILFIPLSFLFMYTFAEKINKYSMKRKIECYVGVTLGSSMFIEFAQLFFRLGQFQLSDLFFNTVGGVMGLGIYFVGNHLIKNRRPKIGDE